MDSKTLTSEEASGCERFALAPWAYISSAESTAKPIAKNGPVPFLATRLSQPFFMLSAAALRASSLIGPPSTF